MPTYTIRGFGIAIYRDNTFVNMTPAFYYTRVAARDGLKDRLRRQFAESSNVKYLNDEICLAEFEAHPNWYTEFGYYVECENSLDYNLIMADNWDGDSFFGGGREYRIVEANLLVDVPEFEENPVR